MSAFDEAWELLKMRSSGGVRKPPPITRRRMTSSKTTHGGVFPRPTFGPLTGGFPERGTRSGQQPAPDTDISIDQESLNMLRNQTNQARMAQTRHLEQLKRTDPEAYQKYLTEMAMGVGAGGSEVQGQTIADALGGMGQQ
tara:strand:+ start:499 stop:918 length:420 start_codon:yes stop_codon:yes gene_type:complete